ncbi:MAG: A/G-specific adenine glycosylase [Desulfuromonadaceae bacterium]|nr:A/G-specific adenine glycosylase [Desulfuromonadaceae bacterium]
MPCSRCWSRPDLRTVSAATAELDCPFVIETYQQALLDWYRRCGRSLPWRQTRDPYRIWLSEIMLQQTGVQAVLGYYSRFLERFPTLQVLAEASIDDVIAQWAGLGYYSRARNLHAAARQVRERVAMGGCFPSDLDDLMALPGVGRSTAGAIRSIAFDRKGVILDGNVRRVLCRLFALQQPPRSREAEKQLWAWAESLTPEGAAHDYAQAIMDLGALICTPRQPQCDRCPVGQCCRARQLGLEQQLPLKTPRKAVPLRYEVALVIESPAGLMVRQRPLTGMLGGLWEFPCRPSEQVQDEEHEVAALQQELACPAGPLRLLGQVRHVYSHFQVIVSVYHLRIESFFELASAEKRRWIPRSEVAGWPLHGSHGKILPLLDVM